MSDDALLLLGLAYHHGPVSQGQRRRAVEERRRYNMRARVEQLRVLRQRRSRAVASVIGSR